METKTLESELKRLNPELYNCYIQTKNEAIMKLLPNIPSYKGSYNSYPHMIGIIKHLDEVLYVYKNNITLNATEIYLLLVSIYLHDIGKAENHVNHDIISQKNIEDHWAEFKIVNKQLAEIVKYICGLHDRENIEEMNLYKEYLHHNTYIDHYGEVRGIILGALLYLGDHLDGSYTRTTNDDKAQTFRKKVLGIRWAPKEKMICTCIDFKSFIKNGKNTKYRADNELHKWINHLLDEAKKNDPDKDKFKNTKIDTGILCELIEDVYKNNSAINLIKDDLYSIGAPIKKWLIECNGHLFDIVLNKGNNKRTEQEVMSEQQIENKMLKTKITTEPLLDDEYCNEVLKQMKKINESIFGLNFHSYKDLANIMREDPEKVYKVKCAVKRNHYTNKFSCNKKKNIEYNIEYYDHDWRLTKKDITNKKEFEK